MPEPGAAPAVEMTAKPGLPGRSLLKIGWACDGDGRPGIETLCDCGGWCLNIIANLANVTGPQEIPLTCPGCQTVTWITLRPAVAGEHQARWC